MVRCCLTHLLRALPNLELICDCFWYLVGCVQSEDIGIGPIPSLFNNGNKKQGFVPSSIGIFDESNSSVLLPSFRSQRWNSQRWNGRQPLPFHVTPLSYQIIVRKPCRMWTFKGLLRQSNVFCVCPRHSFCLPMTHICAPTCFCVCPWHTCVLEMQILALMRRGANARAVPPVTSSRRGHGA